MLVQKNTIADYQTGDIVSFKLVNGDELLAKIVGETATAWSLSKPLTVVPSSKGLGLVQAMFSMDVDQPVALEKASIMMHTTVVKELSDHYILTTTGIQPVTRGGILTGG